MVEATKNVEQQTQRFIYIGPKLKNSKLLKYQVFIGGLPDYITKTYEKYPNIKHLFINIKDLNEAEKQIIKKGTLLNKYYKEVLEEDNNGI